MKALIQRILQSVLGLQTYLNLFSWYKIKTLRSDQGENDFFHFLKLIPKDRDVLDIGANLGIMSYYLSKVSSTALYSFEPIPNNLNTLRWVKRKFHLNNMEIFDVALGNENQEIEMILPVVDHVKKQGLSHVVTEEITEFNEGIRFKASCHRLDDFAPLKDRTIGAIKIDVENFEYQVFLGAEQLLRQHKPVIYCELWDNQNRYDCFSFLQSLGYSVQVLNDKKLEAYNDQNHKTQNFFFIPK